jgi:hypothetical protein
MAFPYSSGDVLTAANLNASSNLVLVTDVTIGSSVSSVTVSSAFNTTYDNYRIVIDIDQSSNNDRWHIFGFTDTTTGDNNGYMDTTRTRRTTPRRHRVVQVDDEITVMTTEEWSAWIDAQVGTEKPDGDCQA